MGLHRFALIVALVFVSSVLHGRADALTLNSDEELTVVPSTPEEAAALGLVPGSPSLRGARWTSTSPDPFNGAGFIEDPNTGELSALLSDAYVGWVSGMGDVGTFVVRTTRPNGTTTSLKIKFDGSCTT